MSTWTEVTDYIKTQLRPGVLGNTDVQKILNSVLAVVNQINAGDYAPDPEALWKAGTTYPADTVPVIWQDRWLVSNVADNLGNVPISTSGVVHPTWRVIGSSAGSGIRIWEAIVYPNTLEVVFVAGNLYYLDRAVVGDDPFVSVDFAVELSEEKWKVLTGSGGSSLPPDVEDALLAAEDPSAENFYVTLSFLLSNLPDQLIEEGTVTFLSATSLRVQDVVFLRGGVARVITDETIPINANSETVNRVDIVYATDAETPLYTAGTEDGSQAIPTVPDARVLIRTLFRNSTGDNTQTSPGGGGGGTPNLQQVTNKGNVTSRTIQHAPATTDAQSATLGQVKSESSGSAVKTKLEGLTGEDRLDASAIKNLPSGGGGGATRVAFSSAIDPTGNFFSEHNQTGAIAYTLGAGLDAATQYGNKTEHYIEANGTGGKPTFSSAFVIQMDTWSNNTGDVNCIIFKVSKTGKILVWLDNVELA